MELLQLQYFTVAAECENFSLTARRFGVPASDVSQTVKRLERELGTALFDRTANRLHLNSAGRIFYEGAKRALTVIAEAQRQIRGLDDADSGEIRLLVETERRVVTLAIERFRAEHPDVSFTFDFSPCDREYDLVISDTPPAGDYTAVPFITEPILLAVSADSPYAEREELELSELASVRFIGMGKDHRLQVLAERICHTAGFSPNTVINTPDPFYVRRCVELGMGVALVPAVSWAGMFSEAIRLIRVGDFSRRTFIFRRNSDFTPKTVELFVEMLVSIANDECEKMRREK